jgi:hypothetical protein
MCRALIYIRPVAILVVLFGFSFTMAAQQAPASPQVKTAEQQFKNIQVLKGTPADQVVVGMHLIEGALGVDCEYCHVANDFPNDDKEPKKTARKMIQMVRDLNQTRFRESRSLLATRATMEMPSP